MKKLTLLAIFGICLAVPNRATREEAQEKGFIIPQRDFVLKEKQFDTNRIKRNQFSPHNTRIHRMHRRQGPSVTPTSSSSTSTSSATSVSPTPDLPESPAARLWISESSMVTPSGLSKSTPTALSSDTPHSKSPADSQKEGVTNSATSEKVSPVISKIVSPSSTSTKLSSSSVKSTSSQPPVASAKPSPTCHPGAQCGGMFWAGATRCREGYHCEYADHFYAICKPDAVVRKTTPPNAVVEPFGQCGGRSYIGPSSCSNNYHCEYNNAHFAQCRPNAATAIHPDLKPTPKTSVKQSSGGCKEWDQCGGFGYNGPTSCPRGYQCQRSDDYWHQCRPN